MEPIVLDMTKWHKDTHLLCLVKNTRSHNADLGTFNLLHEKHPLLLEIDNLELKGVLF